MLKPAAERSGDKPCRVPRGPQEDPLPHLTDATLSAPRAAVAHNICSCALTRPCRPTIIRRRRRAYGHEDPQWRKGTASPGGNAAECSVCTQLPHPYRGWTGTHSGSVCGYQRTLVPLVALTNRDCGPMDGHPSRLFIHRRTRGERPQLPPTGSSWIAVVRWRPCPSCLPHGDRPQ
jgi:hypothetical protein